MEKVHVWMFGVKNAVSAPQPLPIMTSPSIHFTCNQLYRQVELESDGVSRFWYVTLVTPDKGMELLQPRASKSTPRPLPMTCGVCGAPAADVHHYGSVACYSCRAFFRRVVGEHKKYDKCVRNGDNCIVDVVTRTNCKKCRLKRCFEVWNNLQGVPKKTGILGKIPITGLKRGLKIKVGWVLKNSGNFQSNEHRNFVFSSKNIKAKSWLPSPQNNAKITFSFSS